LPSRRANPTSGESLNAERRVGSDFFCVVPVSFVKPLHSSCPVTQAREEHRQGTWLVELSVSTAVLYPDPQSSTSLLLARCSTYRCRHPVHPRPKRSLSPAIGMFYHRRKETSTRESNEAGIALASEQMDSGSHPIKQTNSRVPRKKMDGTSDARSFVHSITLSISSSPSSQVPFFVVTSLNAAYREPARA
jgi:hypothetical protein